MAYIVYGLHSYGLCSYGLHSYVLYSYGLYSYVMLERPTSGEVDGTPSLSPKERRKLCLNYRPSKIASIVDLNVPERASLRDTNQTRECGANTARVEVKCNVTDQTR